MSVPTTATATIEIDASSAFVYDLVTDVTRMGEWSPECVRCDWLGEPGRVGSTFRGRNRSGLARWSTTALVLVADRPREFTFATQYRGKDATRWSYTFVGDDTTTVTETFESVRTPLLIGLVERWFIRDRQVQLEAGMAQTLAAIKAVAETERTKP
jgi:Polyketide cyclase / dehydrase and lipid transport